MALGVVFINPDGGAPPLSEWLGDYARGGAGDGGGAGSSSSDAMPATGLVATHRKEHIIACNWKRQGEG